MGAIRFKNGNINVRFDKDELDGIRAGKTGAFETLTWELEAVDTYLIGEEFCLSNYAMGVTFYSYYSNRVFVFNMGDLETLTEGKTVKLYASVPSECDREMIEAQG